MEAFELKDASYSTRGNKNVAARLRRWAKYFVNYVRERACGLDFSMVYVGQIQRNTPEYHGYSMTDEKTMMKILRSIPIDPAKLSFVDVGCGKGMCMKCACNAGYKRVAGIDLDEDLLRVARKNMRILKLNAECICINAAEYGGYADFDVFYFYNPFGRSVFEAVIGKIIESQHTRPRDIWAIYLNPENAAVLEDAGFVHTDTVYDASRDHNAFIYRLAKPEH